MKNEITLFPSKVKTAGWLFISAGFIIAVLFAFFNLVINLPVFAIFSSFLETKYFTTFTTNFTDEITLLLLIGGMFLVVFSKDYKEERENLSEIYNSLRLRSMFKAIYYNTITILFTIIFVFGQGFFWVLVINLTSTFIVYILIFEITKRKVVKT